MKWVAYSLIVLPVLAIAVHVLADTAAIARCIEAGGVFDYATSSCREDIQYSQARPYLTRYWWVLAAGSVLVVVGLTLALRGRTQRPQVASN